MRTFAIIVMLLGMPLLSRAQTAQNSWGALNSLHAGQRIEIVETHLKKHNGMFSTVTDEAIRGIAAISSNFQRNAADFLCN